jgi:hypothetical protein
VPLWGVSLLHTVEFTSSYSKVKRDSLVPPEIPKGFKYSTIIPNHSGRPQGIKFLFPPKLVKISFHYNIIVLKRSELEESQSELDSGNNVENADLFVPDHRTN